MPLRPMGREQMWMLPPTLDELLPLDHPARFVAEFVDALDREDWGELEVEIDGEVLGAPAYHPRALLSVWLYGFMTGVPEAGGGGTLCQDQIPYLWLTGWQHPDHNTLWRFYRGHRQAMKNTRGHRDGERQPEQGEQMDQHDHAKRIRPMSPFWWPTKIPALFPVADVRLLIHKHLRPIVPTLAVKGFCYTSI